MPRGFSPHSARPATSRATSVPGPGNAAEDDILKARQKALNLDPFTAEHMAAYAAFCGVTDRNTAHDLHRSGVTWDDVNDYSALARLDPSDFTTMKDLKRAGASPRRVVVWNQTARRHNRHLNAFEIVRFSRADLHPKTVEPFLAAERHGGAPWTAEEIISYLAVGIAPDDANAWLRAGIHRPASITTLHKQGCKPITVSLYASRHTARFNLEQDFMTAYRRVRVAAGNPDLAAIAMYSGISPSETACWAQIKEPLFRIDLFMRAGISSSEWFNDPTIRDADDTTLATLAALRDTSSNLGQLLTA